MPAAPASEELPLLLRLDALALEEVEAFVWTRSREEVLLRRLAKSVKERRLVEERRSRGGGWVVEAVMGAACCSFCLRCCWGCS